jgi:hypothetical protein
MELDAVIHGVETSNLDVMKHGVDLLGPKLSLSFIEGSKENFFKKNQIVKNWGTSKHRVDQNLSLVPHMPTSSRRLESTARSLAGVHGGVESPSPPGCLGEDYRKSRCKLK